MTNFANLTASFDEQKVDSRHGDGISRPVPGESTQMYRLRVVQAGVSPMKAILPAESADKALEYGKARWPNAVINLA
jgi:hypothetical protein